MPSGLKTKTKQCSVTGTSDGVCTFDIHLKNKQTESTKTSINPLMPAAAQNDMTALRNWNLEY